MMTKGKYGSKGSVRNLKKIRTFKKINCKFVRHKTFRGIKLQAAFRIQKLLARIRNRYSNLVILSLNLKDVEIFKIRNKMNLNSVHFACFPSQLGHFVQQNFMYYTGSSQKI
jgi:hypothetical protein